MSGLLLGIMLVVIGVGVGHAQQATLEPPLLVHWFSSQNHPEWMDFSVRWYRPNPSYTFEYDCGDGKIQRQQCLDNWLSGSYDPVHFRVRGRLGTEVSPWQDIYISAPGARLFRRRATLLNLSPWQS